MNKMKKIRFLFIYVTKHQMQTKITAKTNIKKKSYVFVLIVNKSCIPMRQDDKMNGQKTEFSIAGTIRTSYCI